MNTKDKIALAHWAKDLALKNGANEASILLGSSKGTQIEIRDQKIDNLTESIQAGLSISLYVDNKYSSHSTNRLDKTELERFIKEAIRSTKYLSEDKFRTLPDPELYYKNNGEDLKLNDGVFNDVSPEEKIKLAMQVEAEAKEVSDKIVTVSASYGDNFFQNIRVKSNGFEGISESTNYFVSANTTVKGDDGVRPSGSDFMATRFWKDVNGEGIGKVSVEKALRKLGAEKIASGKYPMLVENRVSGRFMRAIMGDPISGQNLQQKQSFLLDKLNKKVASSKLSITDNPLIESGLGSQLYDSEGVAAKVMPIIENGVLRNYYIDTYYGKKLKMQPTTRNASNLEYKLGNKSPEEIIKGLPKAIMVTGFNGGNSNPSTGDFSYGVEGFFIENGTIVKPISGMNITGNMLETLARLVDVGNDPRRYSANLIPCMLFDAIDFSGL